MEAIILAGGFGTRLQTIVSDVPKPMAPIQNEPFLKYLFDFLKKYEVKKVILSVHYKKEIIMSFFKNSFEGIEIEYSIEEKALGTGGAIKQSLSMCKEENIIVLNGDTFFDVDLTQLMTTHKKSDAILTLALKPMKNFDRYGVVNLDQNNKIIGFEEKQYCEHGLINGGIYVLNRKLLDNTKKENFSFEAFMNEYYTRSNFYSMISDSYFIDIGIPEDYYKAEKELKNVI